MKESDKKVKELWDIVLSKKEEIQSAEKPNWLTNCNFSFTEDKSSAHASFNLQVVNDPKVIVEALAFLNLRKQAHIEAAKELGINLEFKWCGFKVEDWKQDFVTRLNKIKITDKKKELATLENRLSAILSPELKAELELQEIERLLKNS